MARECLIPESSIIQEWSCILDSKLKDKFLFFLGKLNALKDEIYDAQDDISKEEFETGEKEFDIVDFVVFDLICFLFKLKDKKDGDNIGKGYTTGEKKYFHELYDSFNSYMPIEIKYATELVEKQIKDKSYKEEIHGDRFELLIKTISCFSVWSDIEETPPGFFYIMNFDYEYSSKGNYLMSEYVDLLLTFGRDFIAFNKDDYNGILSFIENVQNAWVASVDEFITDIEFKSKKILGSTELC